jgi:phosphomannomutase
MEPYRSINKIDSVKIFFSRFVGSDQSTNTSPILRLSIEARNQERLDEMTKLIKSVNAN